MRLFYNYSYVLRNGFISGVLKMHAAMYVHFFVTLLGILSVSRVCFCLFYNAHTNIGIIIGKIETVKFQNRNYQIIKYLGIPYAEDPSNELRFMKPIPFERFKRPYNATYFRPACLQTGYGQTQQVTSEDCLFLNVYAPVDSASTAKKKYPVLIYVHGGKFLVGASNDYAPEVLVAVNDVIVVTINYRLSVFGFLSSGEMNAPGNMGLWDQHLAIKWVRFNIASFGGDIKSITLIGQSAGSASVFYQSMFPGNRGLFQRVIGMSGSALSPWALHKPNVNQFAKELGCLKNNDFLSGSIVERNASIIACLRKKTAMELLMASQSITNEGPTIDGEFIRDHPHEILFPDHGPVSDSLDFFRSLDVVSGVTNMDGTNNLSSMLTTKFGTVDFNSLSIGENDFKRSLVPALIEPIFKHQEVHNNNKPVSFQTFNHVVSSVIFQYTNWTGPDDSKNRRDNALKLATHVDFSMPCLQTVDAHMKESNSSTYFYEFTHNPTFRFYNPSWVTGAGHGSELFFVFGFAPDMLHGLGLTKRLVSKEEMNLSKFMMRWITNFAKTG